MHAPVPNQPAAKIVKAAPVERQIEAELLAARSTAASAAVAGGDEIEILLIPGREWALFRPAQPQIPVERVGHGRRCCDFRHALRPRSPAGPGVYLADFADLARPDDLAGHARRVVRIALVAHLRCDLVLFGR